MEFTNHKLKKAIILEIKRIFLLSGTKKNQLYFTGLNRRSMDALFSGVSRKPSEIKDARHFSDPKEQQEWNKKKEQAKFALIEKDFGWYGEDDTVLLEDFADDEFDTLIAYYNILKTKKRKKHVTDRDIYK